MKALRALITGLLAFTSLLCVSAFASYTETVLYSFPRSGNVNLPTGLIADSAGNFYGVADTGGTSNLGGVFELTNTSSGWTSTVLYSFAGGTDGEYPSGSLVMDASGNLYGSTYSGGSGTSCTNGCGQVYELSPSSSGWTKTVLHSFDTTDGLGPNGTLTFDSAGNLFGTTQMGGANGDGTVFELSPSASGWVRKTLYSFNSGTGAGARGPVSFDSLGRLYGTTQYGGTANDGTIYQLSPPTSTVAWWTYRRLHAFNGKDGMNPLWSNLIFDAAGNMYGTAVQGGISTGSGVVYELSPTSTGGWKLTVLHSFSGGNDGSLPESGLVFDASGNLWGTAETGGLFGFGTVYEMTRTSSGHWSLTNQHSFSTTNDGFHPQASVIIDAAGNVFGVTTNGGSSAFGTVWELSPSK